MSNKDLPLVSIVIPVYNGETYLEESIISAINQTYQNLEIVVIDNGSTDQTRKICEKFISKIKYYYKSHGGPATSFNLGIEKMNGEWLKWFSSDDTLTYDAVESLMNKAIMTGGQIIYSDYDVIDGKGNFVRTVKEDPNNTYFEFASKLWLGYIGNANSTLIHRSCFETVGPLDDLGFGEDYDWWLRACLVYRYKFFHLTKPILKYRIHPNQISQKRDHEAFEKNQMLRKRTKELILNKDPDWWKTLVRYRKIYNKLDFKTKIKRILRNILRQMPHSVENRVMAWRIKSLSE